MLTYALFQLIYSIANVFMRHSLNPLLIDDLKDRVFQGIMEIAAESKYNKPEPIEL